MYVHKRINYYVHIIYEIQIGNNDFVFSISKIQKYCYKTII